MSAGAGAAAVAGAPAGAPAIASDAADASARRRQPHGQDFTLFGEAAASDQPAAAAAAAAAEATAPYTSRALHLYKRHVRAGRPVVVVFYRGERSRFCRAWLRRWIAIPALDRRLVLARAVILVVSAQSQGKAYSTAAQLGVQSSALDDTLFFLGDPEHDLAAYLSARKLIHPTITNNGHRAYSWVYDAGMVQPAVLAVAPSATAGRPESILYSWTMSPNLRSLGWKLERPDPWEVWDYIERKIDRQMLAVGQPIRRADDIPIRIPPPPPPSAPLPPATHHASARDDKRSDRQEQRGDDQACIENGLDDGDDDDDDDERAKQIAFVTTEAVATALGPAGVARSLGLDLPDSQLKPEAPKGDHDREEADSTQEPANPVESIVSKQLPQKEKCVTFLDQVPANIDKDSGRAKRHAEDPVFFTDDTDHRNLESGEEFDDDFGRVLRVKSEMIDEQTLLASADRAPSDDIGTREQDESASQTENCGVTCSAPEAAGVQRPRPLHNAADNPDVAPRGTIVPHGDYKQSLVAEARQPKEATENLLVSAPDETAQGSAGHSLGIVTQPPSLPPHAAPAEQWRYRTNRIPAVQGAPKTYSLVAMGHYDVTVDETPLSSVAETEGFYRSLTERTEDHLVPLASGRRPAGDDEYVAETGTSSIAKSPAEGEVESSLPLDEAGFPRDSNREAKSQEVQSSPVGHSKHRFSTARPPGLPRDHSVTFQDPDPVANIAKNTPPHSDTQQAQGLALSDDDSDLFGAVTVSAGNNQTEFDDPATKALKSESPGSKAEGEGAVADSDRWTDVEGIPDVSSLVKASRAVEKSVTEAAAVDDPPLAQQPGSPYPERRSSLRLDSDLDFDAPLVGDTRVEVGTISGPWRQELTASMSHVTTLSESRTSSSRVRDEYDESPFEIYEEYEPVAENTGVTSTTNSSAHSSTGRKVDPWVDRGPGGGDAKKEPEQCLPLVQDSSEKETNSAAPDDVEDRRPVTVSASGYLQDSARRSDAMQEAGLQEITPGVSDRACDVLRDQTDILSSSTTPLDGHPNEGKVARKLSVKLVQGHRFVARHTSKQQAPLAPGGDEQKLEPGTEERDGALFRMLSGNRKSDRKSGIRLANPAVPRTPWAERKPLDVQDHGKPDPKSAAGTAQSPSRDLAEKVSPDATASNAEDAENRSDFDKVRRIDSKKASGVVANMAKSVISKLSASPSDKLPVTSTPQGTSAIQAMRETAMREASASQAQQRDAVAQEPLASPQTRLEQPFEAAYSGAAGSSANDIAGRDLADHGIVESPPKRPLRSMQLSLAKPGEAESPPSQAKEAIIGNDDAAAVGVARPSADHARRSDRIPADADDGGKVKRQDTLPYRVVRTASAAKAAFSRKVFKPAQQDPTGEQSRRPGVSGGGDDGRVTRADTISERVKGRLPQLVKLPGRGHGSSTRDEQLQGRAPRAYSVDPTRPARQGEWDVEGGVPVKSGGPLFGRLRVLPAAHDAEEAGGGGPVAVETGGGGFSSPLAARGVAFRKREAGPDGAEYSDTAASAAGTAPSRDPAAEEAAREVFGSAHADDGPGNADGMLLRTRRWLAGRFYRA